MRECFDVEPLDYVERLVFVATPHHGSFLATRWYSRLFAKLIAVPGEVTGVATRLFSSTAHERLPPGMEPRVPTSLDNMDPKSPFLRYLAAAPIDARIRAHSIIPIGDAEEPAGANDGVVEYESAHIEGVEPAVHCVPAGDRHLDQRQEDQHRRTEHEDVRACQVRDRRHELVERVKSSGLENSPIKRMRWDKRVTSRSSGQPDETLSWFSATTFGCHTSFPSRLRRPAAEGSASRGSCQRSETMTSAVKTCRVLSTWVRSWR